MQSPPSFNKVLFFWYSKVSRNGLGGYIKKPRQEELGSERAVAGSGTSEGSHRPGYREIGEALGGSLFSCVRVDHPLPFFPFLSDPSSSCTCYKQLARAEAGAGLEDWPSRILSRVSTPLGPSPYPLAHPAEQTSTPGVPLTRSIDSTSI